MYGYTMSEPELWKEVWLAPRYYVSTWGRIINSESGVELTPTAFSQEYPRRVNFRMPEQTYRTMLVHRVVADAFMGNYTPNKQITFLDGDRWNAHILNLKPVKGIPGMFLGGAEWIPLRRLFMNDDRSFQNVIDASKETGVNPSEIYDNLRGDRRHIRGDVFEWRWIEEVPLGSELISWSGASIKLPI